LSNAVEELLYHKLVGDSIFFFNSNGTMAQSMSIDYGSQSVPEELQKDSFENGTKRDGYLRKCV